MKYRSKPHLISALQFDGTFTGPGGLEAVDEFVSAHDIENAEATCQGKTEPLALDVTTAYGLRTLEAGDYIYVHLGGLYAESKSVFEKSYETCND